MTRFWMGVARGALVAALGAALLTPITRPTPALAQQATPRFPSLLTPADRAVYLSAFALGAQGDWDGAAATASAAQDKTLAKAIDWFRYQQKDTTASFDELAQFLDKNPDWPRRAMIQKRAEEAIADGDQPRALAFFKRNPPISGTGHIRYGLTLIANGDRNQGLAEIKRGWIDADLPATTEMNLIQAYGSVLTQTDHIARANRLLIDGDAAGARRLLPYLPPDHRAMVQAAVNFLTRARNADKGLAAVPAARRGDPGLLFTEINYLRALDRDDEATNLLAAMPDNATAILPERWWRHQRYAAQRLIRDGRYPEALKVVSNHNMADSINFLDAEWMAGWIALRFTRQTDLAISHFKAMVAAASAPISVGRGHYWLGRAYAAKGDSQNAAREYGLAAALPQVFYGQLAAFALGATTARPLPADPVASSSDQAAFERNETAKVARLLLEIGEVNRVRPFIAQAMAAAKSPGERALIADMAALNGNVSTGVIAAKEASAQGTLLASRGYPIIAVPDGGYVEKAFSLAITRQESEFRPDVISSAGAMGLMQLMPATARLVARDLGLPFQQGQLLSDPDYNTTLGVAHLDALSAGFAGSYVMTAGAYNAGAGRISQWMDAYGDPRSPTVDIIDWIELIPFEETRNYVQRVIENTEVYRQRLSGGTVPLGIANDLLRGSTGRTSPVVETAPRNNNG